MEAPCVPLPAHQREGLLTGLSAHAAAPATSSLEEQTISIQLHLSGEQSRRNRATGAVFSGVWGLFFHDRQHETHGRGRDDKAGSQLQ